MLDEYFAAGNSVIHRIDPRFKLVVATLFSFIVALSNEFQTLVLSIMISIVLVIISKLDMEAVMRRLFIVFGFLLLLWIVLPLTYKGGSTIDIGFIKLSIQGIILSGKITLKSFSIIFIFISLISTMTFSALGHAMDALGISDKIVHLFLITFRYIFVIEQEYKRLLRAVKVRGFKPKISVHTYKTYAYIIGMLFVRALSRGDRVYQAMLCSGFKGKFYSLHKFNHHYRNWIFALLLSAVMIALVIFEILKIEMV